MNDQGPLRRTRHSTLGTLGREAPPMNIRPSLPHRSAAFRRQQPGSHRL
jgi:hypothetical protein